MRVYINIILYDARWTKTADGLCAAASAEVLYTNTTTMTGNGGTRLCTGTFTFGFDYYFRRELDFVVATGF